MTSTEELIRLSQGGDQRAKEILLEENAGLIWSVAKRFFGRGTEPDDLYQLGCLGFIKAIDGFDLTYGTQFSTYAVPKISGEIRRFLRDDGALKVSRGVKERAATIKIIRNQLSVQLCREPTIQEIAKEMCIEPEDVASVEIATASVESIQQCSSDDGYSLENILTDTISEEILLEHISLRQGIEKLSKKEALVIKLRYFHGLTQQRISQVLNVSQVQVSRIEKKAIIKLKEILC